MHACIQCQNTHTHSWKGHWKHCYSSTISMKLYVWQAPKNWVLLATCGHHLKITSVSVVTTSLSSVSLLASKCISGFCCCQGLQPCLWWTVWEFNVWRCLSRGKLVLYNRIIQTPDCTENNWCRIIWLLGCQLFLEFMSLAFSFMLGESYSGDLSLCCCVHALLFQRWLTPFVELRHSVSEWRFCLFSVC